MRVRTCTWAGGLAERRRRRSIGREPRFHFFLEAGCKDAKNKKCEEKKGKRGWRQRAQWAQRRGVRDGGMQQRELQRRRDQRDTVALPDRLYNYYSYGLCSDALCSYGLNSYGLYSYGPI